MNKKNIKWATIVPLIGGLNFGVEKILGTDPEYVLSYSPFASNETHYINHLREKKNWKGDYVFVDQDENYKASSVDMVVATCPCAGLSSISRASSGSNPTNQWMYKTAEYVLGTIKPQIFWGENAPRLFSDGGKEVVNNLYKTARQCGYSLSLYFTESRLHGNPQIRPRTFYFFTKGDKASIFPFWDRKQNTIESILDMPVDKDDPMNILMQKTNPFDCSWIKFIFDRGGFKNFSELYDSLDKTSNVTSLTQKYMKDGENFNDVAVWMEGQGLDRAAKRARAMQLKLDDKKGFWTHGMICIGKGEIPAFVGGLPSALINPKENRHLTYREGLRIMGFPDTFDMIPDKNGVIHVNHQCQTVPIATAADMMSGVLDYFDGKCDFAAGSLFKQSNKNKRMTGLEEPSLESFLSLH